MIYIALYVDDMLIGAKTLEEIKAISDKLSSKFKLKDLGKVKFMLGIQVDYDREQRSIKSVKLQASIKWSNSSTKWTPSSFETQMFKDNFYRQSKKKMKE